MKQIAQSHEERIEVEECEKEIKAVMDILNKLRSVSEFRTEPYIRDSDCNDTKILAI
jgi:hypothetical protein